MNLNQVLALIFFLGLVGIGVWHVTSGYKSIKEKEQGFSGVKNRMGFVFGIIMLIFYAFGFLFGILPWLIGIISNSH